MYIPSRHAPTENCGSDESINSLSPSQPPSGPQIDFSLPISTDSILSSSGSMPNRCDAHQHKRFFRDPLTARLFAHTDRVQSPVSHANDFSSPTNIGTPLASNDSSALSTQSASSSSGSSYREAPAFASYQGSTMEPSGDYRSIRDTKPQPSLATCSETCNQMVLAFRYLLPRFLLMPIYQILYLFNLIDEMQDHVSTGCQEEVILREASSILHKTRKSIQDVLSPIAPDSWLGVHLPRLAGMLETSLSGKPVSHLPTETRNKLNDLAKAVRSTAGVGGVSFCSNDFYMSGTVRVRGLSGRVEPVERVAYLFSNCLLLFKRHSQSRRTFAHTLNAGLHADASFNAGGLGVSTSTPLMTEGLVFKMCIPLNYFHLTDLGTEVTDSFETLYLFEMECWNESDVSIIPTTTSSSKVVGHPSTAAPFNMASASSLVSCAELNMDAVGAVQAPSTDRVVPPSRRLVFILPTAEEKIDWLSTLLHQQTRKLFKSYIRELPKQEIPLILPDPSEYCFTEPDSASNLRFDNKCEDNSLNIPVIMAASVTKLIERMTYHAYFDSKTIRTFLKTYRRYITAEDLLDLLIQRFNIPTPDFQLALQRELKLNNRLLDGTSLILRMEKCFQSAYKRCVQYRVLSFITKWIKEAMYYRVDFSPNSALRDRVLSFLQTVDTPSLREQIAIIKKGLQGQRAKTVHTINTRRPDILDFGLILLPDQVRLTNVHPVELARQVTLHEWNLYSKVEFWEVNGKEKNDTPNLHRSMQFSNRFQWWLVYSIMSQESMDHRLVVLQRVADLLLLFEQINNLQGIQEARAALFSSSVFRLYDTFEELLSKCRPHHRALFEQIRPSSTSNFISDAFISDYQKQVQEMNPPALPFIAVGSRTHLIHLEFKYSDYILPSQSALQQIGEAAPLHTESPTQLINFWKCQQIADLVDHYLSFQSFPYNFQPDPIIQEFLQNLDPFAMAGVSDEVIFDDLMYSLSLAIQPKDPTDVPTSLDVLIDTSRARQPMLRPPSAVESRIGTLLSAVPLDANMTADSKEFKQLTSILLAAKGSDQGNDRAATTELGTLNAISRGSLTDRGKGNNSGRRAQTALLPVGSHSSTRSASYSPSALSSRHCDGGAGLRIPARVSLASQEAGRSPPPLPPRLAAPGGPCDGHLARPPTLDPSTLPPPLPPHRPLDCGLHLNPQAQPQPDTTGRVDAVLGQRADPKLCDASKSSYSWRQQTPPTQDPPLLPPLPPRQLTRSTATTAKATRFLPQCDRPAVLSTGSRMQTQPNVCPEVNLLPLKHAHSASYPRNLLKESIATEVCAIQECSHCGELYPAPSSNHLRLTPPNPIEGFSRCLPFKGITQPFGSTG